MNSAGRLETTGLDWAAQQFGQTQLGDTRRTRRAVKVAAAMAAHPAGSIPQQNARWSQTKAAYRLFAEDDVTFEGLERPHWMATRQAASASRVVLMVQDGSQVDYTRRKIGQDLGPIGDGKGRGLMLHSVLAVDPAGGAGGVPIVLGLADQQCWRQREVPKGETRTQRKVRQRKARVWLEAVSRVGRPSVSGSVWLHVCDREADNFDFFDTCRREGVGFVVRAAQDRRAAMGHTAEKPDGYLLSLARSLAATGSKRLYVRRRPTAEPGWRELKVAYGAVTVFAPWLDRNEMSPLACWVVRVWDDAPGHEPIEWVLVSSEPAESLSAALKVADWYSCRWLIEEYHKCLKTGCRVEQRQLEDVGALEALIGMLAVLAVRLLQLKQQAKLSPERPARECVSREHLGVLAAYWQLPAETMTVYQFWRRVAMLGGFLARKSDGEPGWQTLWAGWQKLDLMTLGVAVVEAQRSG